MRAAAAAPASFSSYGEVVHGMVTGLQDMPGKCLYCKGTHACTHYSHMRLMTLFVHTAFYVRTYVHAYMRASDAGLLAQAAGVYALTCVTQAGYVRIYISS